jgi:hypothetical protein
LYATSLSPLIFPTLLHLNLQEEQYRSNHLLPGLHVTHEDILLTHRAVPNIPSKEPLKNLFQRVPRLELTSGKLEQILAIASLTSNCVSENPLVSINVFARLGADIENDLVRGLGNWWRLAAFKHLGIYLRDSNIVMTARKANASISFQLGTI